MSDAPKQIWATRMNGEHLKYAWGDWDEDPDEIYPGTEYVRADLLEASQARVAALDAQIKAALDACDCADGLVAQQDPISAASVTIWVRRALKAQTGR